MIDKAIEEMKKLDQRSKPKVDPAAPTPKKLEKDVMLMPYVGAAYLLFFIFTLAAVWLSDDELAVKLVFTGGLLAVFPVLSYFVEVERHKR